jgi:hypothetical protein
MYFIYVFIASTQRRKQETCRKFNFETLFMTVNLIPFYSILINAVYVHICVYMYVQCVYWCTNIYIYSVCQYVYT